MSYMYVTQMTISEEYYLVVQALALNPPFKEDSELKPWFQFNILVKRGVDHSKLYCFYFLVSIKLSFC